MDNPESGWKLAYFLATSLIGQKVTVDKQHMGIIKMMFGGPLELFFVVVCKDDIFYIDVYDKIRLELI